MIPLAVRILYTNRLLLTQRYTDSIININYTKRFSRQKRVNPILATHRFTSLF
jgi:hypothetical protein